MFAVVNHFDLDVPVESIAAEFERTGAPLVAAQPGFRGVHLVRMGERSATVIIFWESLEAANAGGQAIGPTWFHDHIAPHLASEQQRSVGEVMVSRPG